MRLLTGLANVLINKVANLAILNHVREGKNRERNEGCFVRRGHSTVLELDRSLTYGTACAMVMNYSSS